MRVLVVINERAGNGDAGIFDCLRRVGLAGHEVVMRFTHGERRVESFVQDAEEFDRIISVGGDGTTSAILYATRSTNVPVLVYPAGTANLLAANLGMPLDASALAEVLISSPAKKFDLGEMETVGAEGLAAKTGFAVMAGAGYDAAIMQGAEPLKPTLGAAAYLLAALTTLNPTTAQFHLKLDGKTVETDGIAVLVANFGKIQFDLPVTPGSDPRDAKFEIAVLRSKNTVGLLPALAAAVLDRTGEHIDNNAAIDTYCAETVEVRAEPALTIQTDGDVLASSTPFTARVLPGAATLLVPPGSAYLD